MRPIRQKSLRMLALLSSDQMAPSMDRCIWEAKPGVLCLKHGIPSESIHKSRSQEAHAQSKNLARLWLSLSPPHPEKSRERLLHRRQLKGTKKRRRKDSLGFQESPSTDTERLGYDCLMAFSSAQVRARTIPPRDAGQRMCRLPQLEAIHVVGRGQRCCQTACKTW